MNELIVKENEKIEKIIYVIRGKQVMLDSDLGFLYGCKNGTKTINQAVKRNQDKFPKDFCFQLTEDEFKTLRSQIGTLELKKGKYTKYLPFAFTEQGVAMLSALLKTNVAIKQSIAIMNAFVAMRRFLSSSLLEQNFYKNKILYHCGSSFKDLGKKCFCISKIDNSLMINDILRRI